VWHRFEHAEIRFELRNEACLVNSWSSRHFPKDRGSYSRRERFDLIDWQSSVRDLAELMHCGFARQIWAGGELALSLNGIVQSQTGRANTGKVPDCSCEVLIRDQQGGLLLAFNQYRCFRMRILTATLKVYVKTREDLAPETYTRVLQGKETLRDIRKWACDCIITSTPSSEERRRVVRSAIPHLIACAA